MKLDNGQILLWNEVMVKVLDVRHVKMMPGENLSQYRIPASMFLFSIRGSAQVQLERTEYLLTGFQLLHSGKGTKINIKKISYKDRK
ncbi:hypothetical protein KDN24_10155 [Bacillus sp. Bva_UNVM-123]|uniref:hypothetical protein n=1 Tax=Bacillus sp. Bva_UNVM-123 TaxID=2829798 RepID=UPI00391EF2F1